MTSPPNPTSNSILVRSTNWVGDAILTTPVYRTLRQNHPKARIVVVARPWVAGVLEGNPNIDTLMVDDGKGFSNTRKVAKKARAANDGDPFDLGLSLPNSFGAALLLKLAGARRRVGFDLQLRRLLLTDPITVPPWLLREHQVEYYLYLLRDICDNFTGVRELDFILTEENRSAASGFLSAEKVTFEQTEPIIGIAPGAAFGTAKRWPAERYAALVAKLTSETGAHCLLIGSKTEAEAAAGIMGWLSENVPASLDKITDTCGKTPTPHLGPRSSKNAASSSRTTVVPCTWPPPLSAPSSPFSAPPIGSPRPLTARTPQSYAIPPNAPRAYSAIALSTIAA